MNFILSMLLLLGFPLALQAGEPICASGNSNSALVIVDMQPFFADRTSHPYTPANLAKVEQLLQEQMRAIK